MIAVSLRTEHLKNPLGIDIPCPLLTWQCQDGKRQSAYEVTARTGGNLFWESGRVSSSAMQVRLDAPLISRQHVTWRVRLWDENGEAGPWSEEAFFEMGLLTPDCWQAVWINPEKTADGKDVFSGENASDAADPGTSAETSETAGAAGTAGTAEMGRTDAVETGQGTEPSVPPHRPASWLRRTFSVESPGSTPSGAETVGNVSGPARLYITAHGVYEAYLNGRRIGDFVLAPGIGNYDFHVPYQTYDVSGLLKEGENELLVQVGDGWYRGCSGTDGDRNLYGEDIALLAQLEIGGRVVCATDGTWEAAQDGPLRSNDLQMGEVYDARRESPLPKETESVSAAGADGRSGKTEAAGRLRLDLSWHSVQAMDEVPRVHLCCTNAPAIREQERFPGKLFRTTDGSTVIDFGQNLAGYVEFSLTAHEGDRLVLWHGETLDEHGNFTQENFQDRNRHKEGGVDQKVVYICREGENHYKTTFSIWGFRYAKVETDIDLEAAGAQFTAIAVYSDMDVTASFFCSNADVNQLFSNALWSMKGNFCDIPTDCPTRERAGWTGDTGIFVETGLTLMDSAAVYRRWLGEVRLQQRPDGKVMNIAPRNNAPSFFSEMLAGSTGWGDAVIQVPWALYRRTGDARILEENYEMMQRWYGYLTERARQDDPRVPMDADDPYREYTVTAGIDYGEWCEPGVDSQAAMRASNYPVATAYFAYSGRLLSEIAAVLGETEDAARYAETAEKARIALRRITTDNGVITSEKEADYVRPLAFGLMNAADAARAADDLDALVRKLDYHLNTGFLSTPHLCPVLSDAGYVQTAYRLLLQDTCPGWLYEVKKGATTVWETWDGIREDGTVRASLNHYSYGSIVGWLISGVCGIRVMYGAAVRDPEKGSLYSGMEANRVPGDNLSDSVGSVPLVTITPQPDPLLAHAEAAYDSPVGRIESGWTYVDGAPVYTFRIPPNVTAQVRLPDGRTAVLTAGEHRM